MGKWPSISVGGCTTFAHIRPSGYHLRVSQIQRSFGSLKSTCDIILVFIDNQVTKVQFPMHKSTMTILNPEVKN